MRALVKTAAGPGQLEIRKISRPRPSPREVLVEVHSCGICGTDLKIQDDLFPSTPPVVIGHEFSGTIRDLGTEIKDWSIGDEIVAEQHFHHCGRCEFCLTGRRQFCSAKRSPGYFSDGAFAEYITVEASLLHRIPSGVSLTQAALVEPMAIAANAILDKTGVNPGDFVVIIGSGPIALLALQMVKAVGAGPVYVTGLDADEAQRFTAARGFGADGVVNAQKVDPVSTVRNLTGGRGADMVIDLSGAPPAILSGFGMLKKDGRFCAIGLPGSNVNLQWADLVLGAYTVFFSYSSNFRSWEQCLGMMSSGQIRVDGFTDNIYALEDWSKAFELARSGEVLKVIIQPGKRMD